MNFWQRCTLVLSTLAAAATGGVYAYCKYWLENEDPFSVYRHPLQPWMLNAHWLVTPILVFAVGWIFDTHILKKIAGKRTLRASGFALLLVFGIMVGSGYGMVLTDGLARRAAVWTHGVSSTLWFLLFSYHTISGAWSKNRQRQAARKLLMRAQAPQAFEPAQRTASS